MTAAPEVVVRPVAFAVSCLPADHPDAYLFTLRVELRGADRWCVTNGAYCYRKDGHPSYESNPSSRTDRFKKAYRFPLDEAIALATRLAPKIKINGHTVQDILGRGRPTWPGNCQSCGATLNPPDATSCAACGADDIDD